jgi:type IX secretion system PorP/SprF family membrane protein
MKAKIFCAIALVMIIWNASGQFQTGQNINDFFNKVPEIHNMALLPYNPPIPTLTMLAGTQMDGFNRHPMQGSLLFSGFLIDKLGAGLKIDYDKIGLSSRTNIELGLAYYVFLTKPTENKKGGDKFSFNMSGHVRLDYLKQNDVQVINQNDPCLTDASNYNPGVNASASIAFFRENKYYIGISSYQLFPSKTSFMNPAMENLKQRHYYGMGSYTFNLSQKKTLDLEINAIGATADFNYWQWQAGFDFKINKMFSIGAGVKSNGSLKFDLGITAQSWQFGYLCSYGVWNPGTSYTYKAMNNMIFVRKVFNEGRRRNEK